MEQGSGHHDPQLVEEVASTMPHASRHPTSRVATRAGQQRHAMRASVAQSVPVPNGPLMAARDLLRNPPGETASPDAQRQWRDDVDRLLNLAQASPSSAGGSASRQRRHQGGASGSVHSPSVRSARTEDLRAELNCRHAGEDARLTIERARVVEPIRLNYSGSSALVITTQVILTQRTSDGITLGSVGSPPDSTTILQDRIRFTSHDGEFTIISHHNSSPLLIYRI
jgi:hypothetical protein